MTVFLSQGQAVREQFEAGDAGYDSGHYQAIDLTAWLSTNPRSTLATNLGVGDDVLDELPREWRFIVPPG